MKMVYPGRDERWGGIQQSLWREITLHARMDTAHPPARPRTRTARPLHSAINRNDAD